MNDTESLLVMTSLTFAIVMFGVVLVKGPKISPFTKAKFSTKNLPNLITFLVAVACASAIIGLFFKVRLEAVGQYVLLNLFIALVMGTSLWLFHDPKPPKVGFKER